mmetsp:Transcript_34531/g.84560  ORF Transcript_34531/g.84560 Transcript_34531/m.84560 type:complete len:207 (+) Transcript_34531:225-845(+)
MLSPGAYSAHREFCSRLVATWRGSWLKHGSSLMWGRISRSSSRVNPRPCLPLSSRRVWASEVTGFSLLTRAVRREESPSKALSVFLITLTGRWCARCTLSGTLTSGVFLTDPNGVGTVVFAFVALGGCVGSSASGDKPPRAVVIVASPECSECKSSKEVLQERRACENSRDGSECSSDWELPTPTPRASPPPPPPPPPAATRPSSW